MKGKKGIAALMAAMIAAGCSMAPAVSAAQPTVSMDETVYVNLDHYGKTSDVNIVKGCSPNGLTKFTDYGSYTSVKNMSNGIEPSTGTDSVSWEVPENLTRFYYECKPKNEPVLPWTFDISYQLNGVPADPQKLAGASGLVEIQIKAVPNDKAALYYQHNMVLEVMATVDMENALSVQAPGGQLQSMGSTTAVIFAALPGEEKEFTLRIGSDNFELGSITMMMEPAKLDQLDRVKDLKEAKETVEDSADAIYDSLNQTLDQVQALRSGIRELKGGLSSLDQARQTIHESGNTTTVQAGQSLEDLEKLIQESEKMPGHLQQGQQALEDVNRTMNRTIATLNLLTPQLTQLQSCLTDIQADVHKIDQALNDIQSASNSAKKTMGDLSDDLSDLRGNLNDLEDHLDSLSGNLKDLEDSLGGSQTALDPALEQYFKAQREKAVQENMQAQIAAFTKTYGRAPSPEEQAGIEAQVTAAVDAEIEKQKAQLTGNVGGTLGALSGSVKNLREITSELSSSCATGRDLLRSMEKLTGTLEDLFDALGDAAGALEDMTGNIDKVSNAAKDVLETTKKMITHANELNATANQYHGDFVDTLKDSESLATQLNQTMRDSQTLLTSLHNMVTASRADLNGGTQKSIAGMQKVLDESLKGLDNADTIRKANDTVKQTLDDEIDKIETETHLLDIDPDASKVSFTSERNPEPDSLQVILRTAEISTGTEQTDITEIETTPQDEGIWARICKVFQKIWEAITSIFSDEE